MRKLLWLVLLLSALAATAQSRPANDPRLEARKADAHAEAMRRDEAAKSVASEKKRALRRAVAPRRVKKKP